MIIFPGRDFALTIFATAMPQAYKAFYDGQMDKMEVRVNKVEKGGLVIPQSELDAINEYRRIHHSKGNVGAQVFYTEANIVKNDKKEKDVGEAYMESKKTN
jgi:hypothetical protein